MDLDEALHLEFSVSRILKIGKNEFDVALQPLTDGGFTFAVVESDTRGKNVVETRYVTTANFVLIQRKPLTRAGRLMCADG